LGSFLALVSSPEHRAERARLFGAGLETFRNAKSREPSGTLEREWASVATFARLNGSGAPVVSDAATGAWLIGTGTWFHRSGPRSGEEAFLLERYLEAGREELANELEGFFTILIGDGRSREVFAITDLVPSASGSVPMTGAAAEKRAVQSECALHALVTGRARRGAGGESPAARCGGPHGG